MNAKGEQMSEAENLFDSIIDKKSEVKEHPQRSNRKHEQAQSTGQSALPEGKVLVDQSTLNQLLSRISQLENALKPQGETGNASIEWAKLKAKEKSQRKEKPSKSFYTQKDGKILLVTVKYNGAYSSYIGNNRKHKEQLKPLIAQWKKEGSWVDEHDHEEFIKTAIEELQSLEG